MKEYKKNYKKAILSFVLILAIVFSVLPTKVHASEKSTPTRTTILNVSKLTETTDMLESEGWKWVPTSSGGTLTLRNCYIQSQSASSLQLPDGNVTIRLEGENTIETMDTTFNPMIWSDGADGVAALNTTIVAGTEDGKLNILRKDTASDIAPYGFAGNTLNIQSGDIYVNTEFCIIKNSFTMQGGSLKIDAANISKSNGIYTVEGDVNISGGNLDIDAEQIGIYVPGTTGIGGQKVLLTGGDVKIRSGLAGIYAKNITVNTSGNLDLQGNTTALYCAAEGGILEILTAGSLTLSGTYPYVPASTSDGKTVLIGDADYTAVEAAITKAEALNPNDYMSDLTNVKAAVNAVVTGKKVLEQNIVNGYAIAIENAIKVLVYKAADYSKVDAAIAKIPSDLSIYTSESVKVVSDAKSAVERGKNFTEQGTVDGYAIAIENAIKALAYKAADYSKVDAAIAKIPSDLSIYTSESVKVVSDAKNAVERGKNFTEQGTVDGYAIAIENALKNLKKKQVISITNPETGIRVEFADGTLLDHDIVLSVITKSQVEMNKFMDSIDKDNPGLVFAGMYDIKFLKNDVTIQPSRKVKVSIPLNESMKAMTDLKVVYIDDNGKVTIIPSEVKDGVIIFVTDHFSDYGIIGKIKTIEPGNSNMNSPQTGESSYVLLFVMLTFISGATLSVFTKKKKNV